MASYKSPFESYNQPPPQHGNNQYQQQQQQPQQQQPQQPSAGVYGGNHANNWSNGGQALPPTTTNNYSQPPNLFNPAAMQSSFESFTSDPMKKVMVGTAVQMGSSFLGRYLPGVAVLWETLRRYFAVDNLYVRTKLLRVLFPFRHRDWRRLEVSGGDGDSAIYAPPTKDTNAPDLYIPLMGAITFVLIVSFVKGTSMNFTPDVLYEVSQHCAFMQMMEILLIKLLLYLFGHARAQLGFFDVLAFTGYKYVGLCVNMLVAMCFGWWVYYPVLLYTGLSMGYFIVQTFKASSVLGREGKTTVLLAASAFLQLLVMWWLAYTGDISHGTGAIVQNAGDATAVLNNVGVNVVGAGGEAGGLASNVGAGGQ